MAVLLFRTDRPSDCKSASAWRLVDALLQVETKKLILISTVDVFGRPVEVTEETEPAEATHYGAHRHRLEQILAERFSTLVVRLPGLFGPGLKKNAVYDLIHDNNVDRIDSRAVYQFYPLVHIWRDIQIALDTGLSLVHFAAEPVSMREVAQGAFGREFRNEVVAVPAVYDMRTRHAPLFAGPAGYLYGRETCLQLIREFVSQEQRMRKCA